MKAHTVRARLLHAIDRAVSVGSTPLGAVADTSVVAPLSPFLQVLRRLRRWTSPRITAQTSAQAIRQRFRRDMLSMRVGFSVGHVSNMTLDTRLGAIKGRLYRCCWRAPPPGHGG